MTYKILLLAVLLAGCSVEKAGNEAVPNKDISSGVLAGEKRRNEVLYTGWCKVYGKTNVSYAEWDSLRQHYLLPGQQPPPPEEPAQKSSSGDAGSMALGIAIGHAIGSSSGTGRR